MSDETTPPPESARRIAIVGSGISALTAAHLLHERHHITVFEARDRVGGHSHTVETELDDGPLAVDVGFIVYNERNYPGFVRLLAKLGVETQPSDMTFSVTSDVTGMEWAGRSLDSLFAQRRNLVRPRFLKMMAGIVRFNRAARQLLADPEAGDPSLARFLADNHLSGDVVDEYLVPLGAAIWSADPETFDAYPARSLFSFLDQHGLLRLTGRPQWRTVTGGSRRYVDALVAPFVDRIRLSTPVTGIRRTGAGVSITTDAHGTEHFDDVVIGAHSDQALALLDDPTEAEKEVLGGIGYQPNEVVLHTDESVLPARRRAWAAWNYHRPSTRSEKATVTYDMNRLQSLSTRHQVCVTLNERHRIDPAKVLASFTFAHPVFDHEALASQGRRAEIDGVDHTWFVGAYWGHGFHEDGVQSALSAVSRLDPGASL